MLGVKGKWRIIIRRVLYAQDRGTGTSGKGIESERASESGKALERKGFKVGLWHHRSLWIHYNLATTNLLLHLHCNPTTNSPQHGGYNLATTQPLQPCYNTIPTTAPLQSCHSPVTMLQSAHYRLTTSGHYNLAITQSLRIATTWSLQPGHYKLATTWPLRFCHNPVTTNSLQRLHYNPTTILPQPGYYDLATTQSLMLWPGHYKLTIAWSLQPSHYVDYKFLLLSVNLKCIYYSEYMRKQSKLACKCPSLQWVCYSHQCTIKQYAVAIYTLQKWSFNQCCNAMGNYNVL